MEGAPPRSTTLIAAGVQAAGALVIVGVGSMSQGLQLDPWRPLAIAALYLMPAVLAALSLRARPSLLLAAATTSGVLAVAGFSLHSVVFLPVAAVYVLAYTRVGPSHGSAHLVPVVLCPVLAMAAFAMLFVHADPACYTRHASGTVTFDRSPGDVTHGSGSVAAGSDVVESGCTGDTVTAAEATASVALSGLALAAGLGFASMRSRDERVDA